ncbi:unnamed protein product [Nippostrongylus brasiliensis]|uniref:Scavenger receptor class B member 1 n=1 Tax=Nippostrongylus brasiliensis TaxID=27835 RepID=A0A0N4XE55_NIPBR|nr:unnamed protein product [Nippostrongylus brasiliensis]
MQWNGDETQVFYENYKKYVISDEDTCPECSWDDLMTIPNPTGIGAAADINDPQYNLTNVAKRLLGFGLLLLGDYPFVLQIVSILSDALNGGKNIIPIPIPDMPRLGFFQGYNNSRDEEYWVRTGKDDINRLGEIVTWANQSILPAEWWPTVYSRNSGSFCKMHLKKTDELPFFQSFMCRSFTKTFFGETTVHGIPSYTFSVPYEDYDTTADVNVGFRYRNVEKVNYYPDWPSCPDRDPNKCAGPRVDCSLQENLCHNCCNGSYVDGTYLVPPGIFPLVCYPGHLEPTPFAVMYSPPHFVYSPPQMIDSVVGLSPNNETHRPMIYNHEPYSGAVTEVFYRLQVSMPTMRSKGVFQTYHVSQTIIPIFWEDSHATLFDSTYHMLWLGFVFVPRLVDAIKYTLLVLTLALVLFVSVFYIRRLRISGIKPELPDSSVIGPDRPDLKLVSSNLIET